MQRFWVYSAILAVAFSALPLVGQATAGQISPLLSFRDVNVIVTVTDPSDWQSVGDLDTSEESGPFDFDANLSLSLGLAEASGVAAQHSTIGDSGLEASGSLTSTASASLEGAASVIATNHYQVTFSVAERSSYTLQGSLSAGGEGICTFSFLGDDIDHSFTVEDGSVPLTFSGTLPAGQYVLIANLQASVNVNLDIDEQRSASGSYTFDLSVSPSIPNERGSWGSVKSLYR